MDAQIKSDAWTDRKNKTPIAIKQRVTVTPKSESSFLKIFIPSQFIHVRSTNANAKGRLEVSLSQNLLYSIFISDNNVSSDGEGFGFIRTCR